eukprot:6034725-Prymnesium_polylepis.1
MVRCLSRQTPFTARPARQNHEPPPGITLDMDPVHLPHACQHPIHRPVVVRHMSDHHAQNLPRGCDGRAT